MDFETWRIIGFTVWTSALAVAVTLPPGLALAWLLARKTWPGKTLVETLAALPLVLPPVATGLILLKLFGRNGPLGRWLDARGIEVVFTWKAVVVALGVMAFPPLVRSLRAAFEEVPRAQEQAARTLGAGPWRVWWTITLPLARRGLLAGVVLAFARALGEFGATMVLAGHIPGETGTLSMEIWQALETGGDARALPLLGASAALAFLTLWCGQRLAERR